MRGISTTQERFYSRYAKTYDSLVRAHEIGDKDLIEAAEQAFHRVAPSNLYTIVTDRLKLPESSP